MIHAYWCSVCWKHKDKAYRVEGEHVVTYWMCFDCYRKRKELE